MTELIYQSREVVYVKVKVPEEAMKRQLRLLSEDRCLGCEELTGDKSVRRGLCPACYQAAHRAIAAKRRTDQQLIREGKMLPAGTGGRPSTNKFTKELAGG